MQIKAKIIDTIDEFLDIEHTWNRLYEDAGVSNPFLSWQWQKLWIAQFCDLSSIRFVLAVNESEIIAIAPFDLKGNKITLLGDPFFADYADIICSEPRDVVINEIIKAISDGVNWTTIDLFTLPGTSKNIAHLLESCKAVAPYSEVICIHANPYTDTFGKFEDYYKARKKSIRSEMVRTRNILNKICQDWVFISAQTIDEKKEIYAALVDFHLERQKDKVGTSIFDSLTNIQFFENLLASEKLTWQIDMSGIKVDGKFITASISIVENDIFYYWIPSFSPSFSKGSIGSFHVMLLIESCFDSHIKRFDFMGGDEAYKLKWSNGSYNNYRILAYRSFLIKLKADLMKVTINFLKPYKEVFILKLFWVKVSKLIGK